MRRQFQDGGRHNNWYVARYLTCIARIQPGLNHVGFLAVVIDRERCGLAVTVINNACCIYLNASKRVRGTGEQRTQEYFFHKGFKRSEKWPSLASDSPAGLFTCTR